MVKVGLYLQLHQTAVYAAVLMEAFIRKTLQVINDNKEQDVQLITAGKKGHAILKIKITKYCMTIQVGHAILIILRQLK